jgi:predicted thioesterase
MNPPIKLEPGMSIEEYFVVGEEHLAQHIGRGRHKRAVIDLERFLAKVAGKTTAASDQRDTG